MTPGREELCTLAPGPSFLKCLLLSALFFATTLANADPTRPSALPGATTPETDPTTEEKPEIKGTLIAVGGGGTPDQAYQFAVNAAKGKRSKVVILPQASLRKEAGEEAAEKWREYAHNVRVLDFVHPEDRKEPEEADIIWMGGGDQNRLLARIKKHKLKELIRARYVAGAVVGGTSAGAAILSEGMLTGNAKTKEVDPGTTQVVEGLGLLPGSIIDQHFHARRRFNRLFAAVADRPNTIGFGIDEQTALIVQKGEFGVLGDSSVLVLDGRGARRSRNKKGELQTVSGIELAWYSSGTLVPLPKTPPGQ